MYDVIADAVGIDGAVQITGGEPTCRKDLPEIIRMGRAKGFWGIEVNTNGLVIAARDGYLEELVAAGLTGVYLSFDGLTGEGVRRHVRPRHPGRQDARRRAVPRGGHPGGAFGGRGGGTQRRAVGRPSAFLPGQRRRGGGACLAAGVHVGSLRCRTRDAHERGRRDLPAGRAVRRAVGAARRVAAGLFEPAVRHRRVLRAWNAARRRACASVGLSTRPRAP